ncbi:MAG: hypothetical protein ACRC2V_16220 [Xenococcaceae cyanobacterium]
MNDLSFQQLQAVPNTPPGTFFIGQNSSAQNAILLDVSKLVGIQHTVDLPPDLDLEEVCVMVWKLLQLCYQAQERHNQMKGEEDPTIRAFVRPTITIESTQIETPVGIGRGVVNVRVPFSPQTIDPQTELT